MNSPMELVFRIHRCWNPVNRYRRRSVTPCRFRHYDAVSGQIVSKPTILQLETRLPPFAIGAQFFAMNSLASFRGFRSHGITMTNSIVPTERLASSLRNIEVNDVGGLYCEREHRVYEFAEFEPNGLLKRRHEIGRSQFCDLPIIDDLTVSQRHCHIRRREDGKFLLEDDESTNGVFASGVRVKSVILARGMNILLGRTKLTVVGADGKPPLVARTATSFLANAATVYGSDRKAAMAVRKSEATVRRARQRRKKAKESK